MLQAGISQRAFQAHYRQANREIIRDLPYGKLMRLLAIGLAQSGLLDRILRAARREPRLRTALFDAVSGRTAFREVLANSLAPSSLAAITRAAIPLGSGARKADRAH
jgi:hypothetical protein